MSNLTQDEINRVLLQLIDQAAPDRPTDAEAQAIVAWAEGVRIGQHMLEMVLDGDATVRIVEGEPHYTLTPQGMAAAEDLLRTSPDARALRDRLAAAAAGTPLAKGPDEAQ